MTEGKTEDKTTVVVTEEQRKRFLKNLPPDLPPEEKEAIVKTKALAEQGLEVHVSPSGIAYTDPERAVEAKLGEEETRTK